MARRASFSFFYAAVLALVLIACSHSQALTLRDFVRDYVSASAGAVEGRRAEIRSREDAAAALPIADASLYPAEPEEEYAAPRLHGGYKATLTIDIVCKMPQFSMLCNLMGLRNAFGDVRQHIYLDFDEANREVYIKADGTKPLFRFDWCGPVSYDIDDEKLQSSGKGEIRLSKEEPKCMQKNLRVSADARCVLFRYQAYSPILQWTISYSFIRPSSTYFFFQNSFHNLH
mmetsp:Transcript_10246/g.25614  ORF Transcript_10246/g.25614 Transcript_10246/m.25614 type:complete len:230 (-) Transcript_10246:1501-2190(-)